MKKYLFGLAVFCAAVSVSSCRKVETSVDGTDNLGKFTVKTALEGNYVEKVKSSLVTVPFDVNDLIVEVCKYDGDNPVAIEGKKWKVSDIPAKVGLDVGSYCLRGYSVEGEQPEVSDVPYFLGEKDFSISVEDETQVELIASIRDCKVSAVTTDGFEQAFTEWKISVARKISPETEIFSLNKDASSKYMKPSAFIVTVTAVKKNAEVGAEPWSKKIEIDHPEVADWYKVTLDIAAVGTATVAITVDNTLTQKDIIVSIPNDDEDLGDGGIITPDPGGDTPPEPELPGPAIEGLEGLDINNILELSLSRGDIVNSQCKIPVRISITAKDGGIQTLGVLIDSDEAWFTGAVSAIFGGNSFDLANLEEGSQAKNAFINLGILTKGQEIKGEESYVFDITGFMGMLSVNTSPENSYRFTLSVTDANDEHAEIVKTLTVRVVE